LSIDCFRAADGICIGAGIGSCVDMISGAEDDKFTAEESSFVYGKSVDDDEYIGVDVVSCIAISSDAGADADIFTDVGTSVCCL